MFGVPSKTSSPEEILFSVKKEERDRQTDRFLSESLPFHLKANNPLMNFSLFPHSLHVYNPLIHVVVEEGDKILDVFFFFMLSRFLSTSCDSPTHVLLRFLSLFPPFFSVSLTSSINTWLCWWTTHDDDTG